MDFTNEIETTMREEMMVKDLLKKKIEGLKSYTEGDSEILSYRLSEIMVLAKNLYTKLLPEFIETETSDENALWEGIGGIRMHILHLRDCIEDFDSDITNLMENKDNEEPDAPDDIEE